MKLTLEFTRDQIINANQPIHHMKKANLVKKIRKLSKYECMSIPFKDRPYYTEDKPCNILIKISPPKKRAYDPPNWSPTGKAIIDGLTDAKIWKDDNFNIVKYVTYGHGGFSTIKNKYIFEVIVYDYEELVND